GPTSAFAWIDGDHLVFPPLEAGVLDSLTRRIAMDAVPSTTREATTAELADAQGAFLLSTVMEAVPVSEVKGVVTFDPQAPLVTSVRGSIAAAIAEHVVDA
ncbi:MAG: aminotransferase class IV, partial [Miltoncostaeaceae bacterium]